ncbi:Zinc metalloproteinase nas-13 [Toxocara canis]|uniref:Metalloendopeptidase n=1 Tax=Toxocara canis TaxID=6265 RepID=A0A0B2USG8_TOXCA|nr:Zinc metalloproteinase nas-13 [Toxocara canis]
MCLVVFLLLPIAFVGAQDELIDKSRPDIETFLSAEDFDHAKLIRHKGNEGIDDSAMYNDNLYEGDIVDADILPLSGRKRRSIIKNAIRHEALKWPNGHVPYTISDRYGKRARAEIAAAIEDIERLTCIRIKPRTDADTDYVHIAPLDGCYSSLGRTGKWRAEIAAAIEDIERLTCIRIKPRTDADTDYVHIAPLDGCYSSLGRTGGAQNVSIDRGCVYKGTIVHELMHTIGFYHEQARADRDDYVTILWDNVMPGDEDQFDSYPLTEIDHLGTEYDYESVMHYSPKAFSKNGQPTILPKRAEVAIGHKEGLSATDAYKINRLYNCTTARADRDDYVTILWDNVMPGDEDQFDSYPLTEIDHLGTEYDYESVMHYSPKAFSKNGQPTILPKRAEVAIGHKEGLSATDAYKINRLYNCTTGEVTTPQPTTTTEAGPAKCEDLINDCDKILSSGLCDSQLLSEFVKKNCARTCKKCCIDKLSWCARAAEMQLCTKLPQEIPTYCPKSCRQC